MVRTGPIRKMAAVVVVTASALGVAACDTDDADQLLPLDAIYVTALDEALPAAPADGSDTDDDRSDDDPVLPIVYVADFADQRLDIEGQVMVIDAFADRVDLQFVDEPEHIVDNEHPELAPLNEGVLYSISPVQREATSAIVRLERYERDTDIVAVLVTIEAEANDDDEDDPLLVVVGVEDVEPERLSAIGT